MLESTSGTLTLSSTLDADANLTLKAVNLSAGGAVSADGNLTLTLRNNLTHGVGFHAGASGGAGLLTVQVDQANSGVVTLDLNGLALSGSSILLQGSGNDILKGYTSGAGTWTVTGTNSGKLEHANLTNSTNPNEADFSGFSTLVGGDDDDLLQLQGSGTLGRFDGGAGHDTYNIAGTSQARTVVWGQEAVNVEELIGNAGRTDSLQIGGSPQVDWDLTGGSASGEFTASSQTIAFSNFKRLVGGSGSSTFISDGSYAGDIVLNGQNEWLFRAATPLTQGRVTGGGSLTIARREGETANQNSNFAVSHADLYLPDLTGLTGNLIIGGRFTAGGLPLNGTTRVEINADQLAVL
ncbi:hypothetical protein ACQV5M_19160, partial [Leptospira sp. SA-E8]|uniref:hypothetical protein n=1 Tax=Leptospira sp. SA-E8 TaxID=3422259 RepID=UPI003EBC5AA0